MSHPFETPGQRSLLLLGVLLALLPAPVRAAEDDPPARPAEAAAVTEANLFANERFWPYRVALTAPWQPPGREQLLPAGSTGVLIRVERPGAARIDFSADGKYEVPVGRTDLVESANRIRTGELAKDAPNFTWAIATRLVDSDADELVALSPEEVAQHRGFLCVFVDPDEEAFEAIAAGLAPLRERDGVLTILFAQGRHPSAELRERLRALDWRIPFVYDFLSEPYTRTLLPEETPLPHLLLQTDEGRVVFQGSWRADVVPELGAALDAAFGAAPAAEQRSDAAAAR